jgi:multiple sugar transport system substrate-binding protein
MKRLEKAVYRVFCTAILLAGFVLIAAGCGGGASVGTSTNDGTKPQQTQASEPAKAQAPVTITFVANTNQMGNDEAQRYMVEPVQKKHPFITIKFVDVRVKGQSLTELVAAKQPVDIYANGAGNLANEFVPLGLPDDISALIKKYNFDTSRIDPIYFDAIRTGSGVKETIGIPIWNQAFGLIYNKDLFDKFGVTQPKDGMTWDQLRDLAVKLTRDDGGTMYYGLWPDDVYRGANQLGLPFADWDNHKGVFQTAAWKDLFDYWYSLYKIPGYVPKGTKYPDLFNKGQLAMMAGSTSNAQQLLDVKGLNWDVVTYPQNPKAPGFGQRVTDFDLYIAKTSQNKDAAFQVISVVASDEVQREISRNGRISSLKNKSIQDEFGKGVEGFKGKNVVAFTKPKLAPIPEYRDIPAYQMANKAFTDVLYEGIDINTSLRQADETLNKAIQEKMSK